MVLALGTSTVSLILEAVHPNLLNAAIVYSLCILRPSCLFKLETVGITGDILNWLKAFLTSHCQRVAINGQFFS